MDLSIATDYKNKYSVPMPKHQQKLSSKYIWSGGITATHYFMMILIHTAISKRQAILLSTSEELFTVHVVTKYMLRYWVSLKIFYGDRE